MWARRVHVGAVLAMFVATLGGAPSASAAVTELRNDGFEQGFSAGFQAGFVIGEIGAVRLDLPQPGTYQVTEVKLLFGGSTAVQNVTLRIYLDTGSTTPGAQIFNGDYQVTGANDAFSVIDLTADNVMVTGPFRVGIEFQHDGLPSIARDDDGSILASHNFILASGLGWFQSSSFGLIGDWVIRATVEDVVSTPDAGPPIMADASPPGSDASGVPGNDAAVGGACQVNSQCSAGEYCSANGFCTFDCRVDMDCGGGGTCNSLGQCVAGGDGGCSCRVGGLAGSKNAAAFGLFLLAMVALRRRRR